MAAPERRYQPGPDETAIAEVNALVSRRAAASKECMAYLVKYVEERVSGIVVYARIPPAEGVPAPRIELPDLLRGTVPICATEALWLICKDYDQVKSPLGWRYRRESVAHPELLVCSRTMGALRTLLPPYAVTWSTLAKMAGSRPEE